MLNLNEHFDYDLFTNITRSYSLESKKDLAKELLSLYEGTRIIIQLYDMKYFQNLVVHLESLGYLCTLVGKTLFVDNPNKQPNIEDEILTELALDS